MQLYHQISGTGAPLLIVHGLFGSSDNWRGIARQLSTRRQVITVDLRNHGRSFHEQAHSYPLMAEDLLRLLDSLGYASVDLLGHSLGGKVAMQFAHDYRQRLNKLIVVDMAPRQYPDQHSRIFKALMALNLQQHQQRAEIDAVLSADIEDPAVRQFLLMNLYKTAEGQLQWRINLPALYCNYSAMLAPVALTSPHTGPTRFIAGGLSDYINGQDHDLIHSKFADADIVSISNAGHWLHADAPEAFCQLVEQFLDD